MDHAQLPMLDLPLRMIRPPQLWNEALLDESEDSHIKNVFGLKKHKKWLAIMFDWQQYWNTNVTKDGKSYNP